MKQKSPDDMMTVTEIAREFRIGKERIRALCRAGELRHLRVGVKTLIPRWVMLEWVRDNLVTDPQPTDAGARQPGAYRTPGARGTARTFQGAVAPHPRHYHMRPGGYLPVSLRARCARHT
jgi:excisionase family DNA binding protein